MFEKLKTSIIPIQLLHDTATLYLSRVLVLQRRQAPGISLFYFSCNSGCEEPNIFSQVVLSQGIDCYNQYKFLPLQVLILSRNDFEPPLKFKCCTIMFYIHVKFTPALPQYNKILWFWFLWTLFFRSLFWNSFQCETSNILITELFYQHYLKRRQASMAKIFKTHKKTKVGAFLVSQPLTSNIFGSTTMSRNFQEVRDVPKWN